MSVPVGIDVSKESLDVCLVLPDFGNRFSTFKNSEEGFVELLSWIGKKTDLTVRVCMEPTGAYSNGIASYLSSNEVFVCMANPRAVRDYARSTMQRSKTDKSDSFILAEYCRVNELDQWTPTSAETTELRELQLEIDAIKNMIRQEKNRLEAIRSAFLRDEIQRRIHDLKEAIRRLVSRQNTCIESDAKLQERKRLLLSIPGFGETTANLLLALVDFDKLKNPRAAACFVGLTPKKYESGKSIRKREKISRMGSCRLRSALFLPALSAMQYNPTLRDFATRLSNQGKPKMVIVTAVMRKMLTLAVAIVRNRQEFQLSYR